LRQILDGKKPANSQPIRIDIIPGSHFRYSGGGYTVLQQLLIDVTGTPFTNLMQPVLKRLRMTHGTFDTLSAGQAGVAAGHLPDGKQIEGGWFTYPELAAAGLWTTPSDLAQLVIELQRSNAGSSKILSQALTKSMLTPQTENAGLGLVVDGKGASARFSHSGSNVGYKCFLIGYVESGQGAVVMTNSDNGAQLAIEILRSIAAEYGWPDYRPKEKVITKVDSAIYDAYVGEYQLAPGAVITISKEGDKLMSQGPGQPRAELLPESETTFFLREVDAAFTFVKDQSGQVVQVNIRRGGREFQARRVWKQ
jgi:CubicO group peptidase (beta-lactamase class C family)